MDDEILRLARENDDFARAILDSYEANQQYEAPGSAATTEGVRG